MRIIHNDDPATAEREYYLLKIRREPTRHGWDKITLVLSDKEAEARLSITEITMSQMDLACIIHKALERPENFSS